MNERNKNRLAGVHPDLIRVLEHAEAHGAPGFVVTEGVRSRTRQAELFRAGRSQTMNSRHLTGHAVDLACLNEAGRVSWAFELYEQLADHIKAAAGTLGVAIVWGGDWASLRDGPHFELDRRAYPA